MRTGLERDVLWLVASVWGSDNPEPSRKATSVCSLASPGTSFACGVPGAHRHGVRSLQPSRCCSWVNTQAAAGHHHLDPDERVVAIAIAGADLVLLTKPIVGPGRLRGSGRTVLLM
jgi:hypothetical protein